MHCHGTTAVAARTLGVSRSGYYDWKRREPSARTVENTALRLRVMASTSHYFWLRGDLQRARACNRVVHELAVQANDVNHELITLVFAELLSASVGDLLNAVKVGREILVKAHSIGSRAYYFALGNLGAALTELGELDEALAWSRECVPFKSRGDSLWVRLDAFSLLAFKRGHAKTSALVLGCGDAICSTKNHPRQPNEKRVHNLALAALQGVFSKTELKKLMSDGTALSVEEAARIALAD